MKDSDKPKPSDSIFAGLPMPCRTVDELAMTVCRIAKILDEQHAAGQGVLEAAWDSGWASNEVSSGNLEEWARQKRERNPYRAAPVAAPAPDTRTDQERTSPHTALSMLATLQYAGAQPFTNRNEFFAKVREALEGALKLDAELSSLRQQLEQERAHSAALRGELRTERVDHNMTATHLAHAQLDGEGNLREPPAVATGERAIVVGSHWARLGEGSVRVTAIGVKHVTYRWDSGVTGVETFAEFRSIFGHVSDPPAAPGPGSEGSK